MKSNISQHIVGPWTRLLRDRPWWVILVAVVLGAGALMITAGRLGFQTERHKLIEADVSWNRQYELWTSQFAGEDDLLIVVDGGPGDEGGGGQSNPRAIAAVEELAHRLSELPEIEHIVWRFSADQFSPRSVRMLDMAKFEQRLDEAAASRPLLESSGLEDFLTTTLKGSSEPDDGAADTATDAETVSVDAIDQLTAFMEAMRARIEAGEGGAALGALMADTQQPPQHLSGADGRLLFIRATPRLAEGITEVDAAIAAVRPAIREVADRYGDVEIGLTGIEVIEADEARTAIRDSTLASSVALVVVVALLMMGFRSIVTPLLMIIALLIGIAWSFGYLTLVIGHLQIMSIVFVVVLLSLGIDYGIHLASRYERVRGEHPDDAEGWTAAMMNTFVTVGPAVTLGAITTAVAFSAIGFTNFRGVAELGLLAAGGIMLCLVSMLSVLPALLRIVRGGSPSRPRRIHLFNERWLAPFIARPGVTLTLSAIVLAACVATASQVRFDFNLMNLQPPEVSSIQWQQRIDHLSDQSIWFGVSIAESLDEAHELTDRFRRRPTVASVGGAAALRPEDEAQKLQRLREVRQELQPLLAEVLGGEAESDPPRASRSLLSPSFAGRLKRIASALPDELEEAPADLRPAMGRLVDAIGRLVEAIEALDSDLRTQRLARLGDEYAAWRRQVARRLDNMLDTAALSSPDLPADLLRPYISTSPQPRYALYIYPALPEGVDHPLDPDFLVNFIDDLESVDPAVTGSIVQIYHAGQLIRDAYLWAAIYAFTAVVVILLATFRSIIDTLAALIPVGAAFAVTFAVMHLAGVELNAANIIILPLMFGLGVDDGIHVLHRYRQHPRQRPLGMTAGTGQGITITSLTSASGFAALLLAEHRGIRGIGMVMSIGILVAMLACWIILPAMLEFRRGRAGATS